MSADSPKRQSRGIPAVVPPQVVSDRSIIDSVAGFINDVTLTNQPQVDPKDTITWARFETIADISDPTYGEDWELEGNIAPPLLLILGYGLGVQVWAIPANGEAIEVLSWRHGYVTAIRILPTPLSSDVEMANEPIDQFADKRPLMAICEGSPPGCNSQFSSVNFISLKEGTQVKTIKFKNNVLDILANRTSIVITFPERIAVFDARTFEDRLSVTTCYPSPGINPNPVALGSRWMAYSENRLIHSKRSGGGCDGDGVSSYTATVLNAAKSLGKGLRELGEQVAAGLTGTSSSGSFSKSGSFDSTTGDIKQPGVITILDIKHSIKDSSPTSGSPISVVGTDPFIAHFVAHLEAIVALEFDNSGMLLLTADRRGHDFHVFRIQPHPAGSQLAAVHHLYILHRGDTSAKVQNIAFSIDSRWVAVSTLRGTTHVFPINPYGGPAGVRTHASLHVVNRLSRFHRSAGLSVDGRSSSPISHSDSTTFNQLCMPYNNPTIPSFPRPHIVLPLAQLRQPSVLGSPPGSAQNSYTKSSHGRQRLSSLSDDIGKPLSVCAIFAKARSWLLDPPNLTRDTPAHKIQRKAVDSLFIMAGHGALIQYDLDTKLASNVAKEKVCDDTPIELEVEAKAQWNLGRKEGSIDIQPPLPQDNWLMKNRNSISCNEGGNSSDDESRWLSQVEIITHAGPHRRLWMGPQCVFKTYNTPSGAPLSHIDSEAVEIGVNNSNNRPGRSSPMNMPSSGASRSSVPVLIESGSYSSIEQSPKLMERFRHENIDSDYTLAHGESRLKEDLADAMRESPSVSHKDSGDTSKLSKTTLQSSISATTSTKTATPFSKIPDDSDYTRNNNKNYSEDINKMSSSITSTSSSSSSKRSVLLIEKIVNPLGTVTTIKRSSNNKNDNEYDDINNPSSYVDYVIHENCDESLFRPVVAIFYGGDDDKKNIDCYSTTITADDSKPPEPIGTELVVPVIEKNENKKIIKEQQINYEKKKVNHKINTENSSNTLIAAKKEVISKEEEEKKSIDVSSSSSTVNTTKKQESKIKKEKFQLSEDQQVTSFSSNTNDLISGGTTKKTSVIKSGRKKSKEETQNLIIKKENDEINKVNVEKKETTSSTNNKNNEKFDNENKKLLDKKSMTIDNKSTLEINLEETSKKSSSNSSKNKDLLKINLTNNKLPKVASDPKIITKFETISNDDETLKSASSSEKISKIKKEKVSNNNNKQKLQIINKKVENSKQKSYSNEESIIVSDVVAKKENEIEIKTTTDTLQFYEKFTKDSPTDDEKSVEVEKIKEIVIDEIALSTDHKKQSKKIKSQQINSTKSSPQYSPKLSPKNSQKDIESVLDDAKIDDSNNKEITTFTLITKKKSKAKISSPLSLNNEIEKLDETDSITKIKNIDDKNKMKDTKSKTFPSLLFEPLSSTDLSSKTFLPDLSPLEPFESKFDEDFYFKDAVSSDSNISLINFESPSQETQKSKEQNIKSLKENHKSKIETIITTSDDDKLKKLNEKYTSENLIFAMCGSLHSGNQSDSIIQSENSTIECKSNKKSSQYKNLKCGNVDTNDQQYLKLEQSNYHDHTSASSSEEIEESCLTIGHHHEKKSSINYHHHRRHHNHHHHQKLHDDDEELRPLIDGENSACSMISFIEGQNEGCSNNNYDENNTFTSNNDDKKYDVTVNFEIDKEIIETLPTDNNSQSDSSDQTNSSEPGEIDSDIPLSNKNKDEDKETAAIKTTTTTTTAATAEDGLLLMKKQQKQENNTQSSNGKKKSKKKKR